MKRWNTEQLEAERNGVVAHGDWDIIIHDWPQSLMLIGLYAMFAAVIFVIWHIGNWAFNIIEANEPDCGGGE